MQENIDGFGDLRPEEFADWLSAGDEQAFRAACHLIHIRLKGELRRLYENYDGASAAVGSFDDSLDGFLLWLHGGHAAGKKPFAAVGTLRDRTRFFSWIKACYKRYLLAAISELRRAAQTQAAAAADASSSVTGQEARIEAVVTAIAYALQTSDADSRLLLLRWLLSVLDPRRSLGNEAVARALDVSHVAYRVKTHRIKTALQACVASLMRGRRRPSLDEAHLMLRDQLSDGFGPLLYDVLYERYEEALAQHPARERLLALDRQNRRLHESDAPQGAEALLELLCGRKNPPLY